jgi:predicted metal-dependent phosphoesterase TrpH
VAELLEFVEHYTDLDVVAITDHDEVAGALEAVEVAASQQYSFQVIPGLEVTTRDGHLLALFVERTIPMLRSLEYTVDAVHALGGLCVVPHPMSWLTLSVGRRRLLGLHANDHEGAYLDGIETFNPTYAGRVAGERAGRLNGELLGLAETGGSDAHCADLVGTGRTLFPGRTADDLRRAIVGRTTRSTGRCWTASDHLKGVAGQQWRAMVAHPCRKVVRAINGGKGR